MKERPILFTAEMVRALLDGRKTQTRRVIKPQPLAWAERVFPAPYVSENGGTYGKPGYWLQATDDCYKMCGLMRCPYGQQGDKLWVREKHGIQLEPCEEYPNGYVIYAADYPFDSTFDYEGGGSAWRSSIHMPRWASRITLEITGVRVERLQNITDTDCMAEGIVSGYDWSKLGDNKSRVFLTARLAYQELWNSISAIRGFGWEVNPWVWVIEFRVISTDKTS